MSSYETKFDISYENDLNSSYLVIKVPKTVKVVDFQIDMVTQNSCPGVLPIESRYKDNELNIYCNVTSKMALGQYLERKRLSKSEFLDILENISKTILDAEDYLLDSNNFMLDTKYLFLNPETREVHMIYLPIVAIHDISEQFKEFLINLIVYRAKLSERESGDFINAILNYLKGSSFNLKEFHTLVKQIRHTTGGPQVDPVAQYIAKPKPEPKSKPKEKKPKGLGSMMSSDSDHRPSQQTFQPQEVSQAPQKPKKGAKRPTANQAAGPDEFVYKKRFKKSAMIIAIVSQILLGVGLLMSLNKVVELAGDKNTAYMALSLFVISIDGLLFKRLFALENMEEVRVPVKQKGMPKAPKQSKAKGKKAKKDKQQGQQAFKRKDTSQQEAAVNFRKREITNVSVQQPPAQSFQQPVPQASSFQQAAPQAPSFQQGGFETELLNKSPQMDYGNAGDTVLLTETPNYPYLIKNHQGMSEKITIDKTGFIIGRQGDMADYVVSEQAIGRMHAEFLSESGAHYIKDMNSRNGTFVNKQRINSNQPVQLNEGDIIKLANTEFKFMTS